MFLLASILLLLPECLSKLGRTQTLGEIIVKKLLATLALLAITACPAFAQSVSLSPGVAQQPVPEFSRCSSSYAVSITSATTTLINDNTASSFGGHICGFYIQIVSGTSPTFKLITGTGTACGTGAANVTGAYATAGIFDIGKTGQQINFAASKQLCIVTTGTSTPTFVGFISYGYW